MAHNNQEHTLLKRAGGKQLRLIYQDKKSKYACLPKDKLMSTHCQLEQLGYITITPFPFFKGQVQITLTEKGNAYGKLLTSAEAL